jgi:mannose-6-phosphate isomerase-like protein (cupin superfamily)
MDTSQPLVDRYWFIEGNEALPIDVAVPDFWAQLTSGSYADAVVKRIAEADGWLVTAYDMTEDMPSAEMHPEGDELHYLVSGNLDLVLEHDDDANEVLDLAAGESAVVEKGVWHRFVVREPGHGIAITFGRGTQHRPARP